MLKNHRVAVLVSMSFLGAQSGALAAERLLTSETGTVSTANSTASSTASSTSPIDQIAGQLTGTWKTTEPYQTTQTDDGSAQEVFMLMSVAPVMIEGMDNTMYVESALSNAPWSPFRQAVFQLYEYKGKVRLRTYTMAVSDDTLGVSAGMVAAPAYFGGVEKKQLIATLDVELDANGSGFSGSTPYPYPTGVGGAVEMTSSVTFDGTTLTTADRGYDANGAVVWGAGQDASYTFERVEPYAVANERDDGLVIIEYPGSGSEMVVQDGDQMHVHYSGYLADGMMFDSSYPRNQPFVFAFPPGDRAIVGWGIGMEGLSLGAHRKLIIPGDMGYGPNGNPRAKIPGDATLIFNINLVHIDRPEPVEEAADDSATESGQPVQVDPHEGHGHSTED